MMMVEVCGDNGISHTEQEGGLLGEVVNEHQSYEPQVQSSECGNLLWGILFVITSDHEFLVLL